MPAIQIKSPALTLKAGRRALARIRERGLQPADVGIVPGAAGGPHRRGFPLPYGAPRPCPCGKFSFN